VSRIETQATIEAWRRATFGDGGTLLRMATRADTEMAELLVKVSIEWPIDEHGARFAAWRQGVLHEIADVAIVLYGIAELGGFDLRAEHGFYDIPFEFNIARCCSNANASLAEVIGRSMPRSMPRWRSTARGKWVLTDAGHGHHVDDADPSFAEATAGKQAGG
jgi:hypothetical protein